MQDDGKIVVAGASDNGSNWDFALVRYNADGTLDNGFGSGGKVITAIGSSHDRGNSVAVQGDGKIVVAGYSSNGSNDDFALARYNADGTLDSSFGSGGKVTTAIGSSLDRGYSMAVQGDGKIVLAGYSRNDSNEDFALVRYNADGTLDSGFGSGGKVITAIGSSIDEGYGVAVQGNGKIVMAGYALIGGNLDFALVRYNADGTLDSGFGSGGKVTVAIGSSHDIGYSVAVQGDGKIIMAGHSSNVNNDDDFALVRYEGAPLDMTTEAPTLTAPATGAVAGDPAAVNFTLPEAALAGSVKLSFGATELQLAASQETSGAHSFTFNPANPAASAEIASGSAIADGVYTVTLSYQDALGNPAASVTSTSVTIDTTGPTGGTFSINPPSPVTEGTAVTLTATSWSDAQAPLSYRFFLGVAPLAAAGASNNFMMSPLPAGNYTASVEISDALGNVTTAGPLPLVVNVAPLGLLPGEIIVDEPFDTTVGRPNAPNILGSAPENVNQPGGVWSGKGAVGLGGYGTPDIVTVSSRQAVKLTGDIGAVVPIGSAGAYTKPTRLRLEATFSLGTATGTGTTRVGGIGFWSSAATGLANSYLGFYGVTVDRNGSVKLNLNPSDSTPLVTETLPNAGGWSAGGWHTLGMSVDTETGKIYDVQLDGAIYAFSTTDAFSPANTNYAGILVSSEEGTKLMHFDRFTVSVARAEGLVLTDDVFQLSGGERLQSVLANDVSEIGALTVAAVTQGAHGTVTNEGGGLVRYIAGPTFAGSDSFTYTVEAPDGTMDTASVEVVGAVVVRRVVMVAGKPLSKGAPVYRAGVQGSGIPAKAVWSSFGVPAINDTGRVAFLGNWTGARSGAGVFLNHDLLAHKGAIAIGASGAVLSAFKDPLLAEDGAVAFIATLANGAGQTGVTTANNQAIYLDADGGGAGAAVLVAQRGAEAAGVSGSQWKAFSSVVLSEGALAFTGTMVTGLLGSAGPGGVTSGSDTGLWIYNRTTSTMTLALREGGALGGSTVKTIAAFVARAGSMGQGRGVVGAASAQVVVRVTLADGRGAVGTVDATGAVSLDYVKDGSATAYNATTPPLWSAFGLPTQNSAGALAFTGTVKTATGGPTTANNVALYAEDDTTFEAARLVTKGDMAPGVTSGVFSAFQDPVSGLNRSIAFRGTLKTDAANGIGTANNMGIWWRDGAGTLNFVARKGAVAAEAAPAAVVPLGVEPLPKWNGFTSLALSEGTTGPLFVASLINKTPVPKGSPALAGPGGVTTAADVGLWAVDSLGAVRLLLREGDAIGASTVKTFTVLTAVAGSPAQTRGFNNNGQVIVRVTDATGAQHLVRIDVP